MSAQIFDVTAKYSLYSGTIICSLGIVGNTINILVFTQLKLFRNNRCAFYLTVESISNIFYLLFSLTIYILISIYGNDGTGSSLTWCKLRYTVAQTFVLITFTMICCTAADEYFSTNYLYSIRCICTLKLSRYLAFVFICIWITHSVIQTFFYNIVPSLGCKISNDMYIRYATYFTYPVLTGLLPIVIALLCSLFAYQNVRRIIRRQIPVARRRLDRQITAMCFVHVIAYGCLATPFCCYRMYAVNNPISQDKPLEFAIGQLVQVIFASIASLNFAISFYLFIVSSSRFRHQVKFVLVKKCWKRWKRLCGFGNIQSTAENIKLNNLNIEPKNLNMELEEITNLTSHQ
ncbi:unnamed protein product [Adineta steineri]|uniref:G-protein coupled receptors family 1 profile domain-containing protein n=1 Tax=Adineta steineri TaxID=433720 RepID=A0A815K4P2_9BILA|nr:unnamed protein product [Adineta steineri]CAF4070038.1 unnamed protein product [Adineta steineri]